MALSSIQRRLFSLTNFVRLRKGGWRQDGEDEEWSAKALDALMKRMTKNKESLEELERVLRHPELPSKCVTFSRSLDGRLQVCHRKYLPHVIACRVWRWSDLQNHHELKALECCKHPYSSKGKEVCVNPYHYQRVNCSVSPPVVIPKCSEYPSVIQPIGGVPYFQQGTECPNIYSHQTHIPSFHDSPTSNFNQPVYSNYPTQQQQPSYGSTNQYESSFYNSPPQQNIPTCIPTYMDTDDSTINLDFHPSYAGYTNPAIMGYGNVDCSTNVITQQKPKGWATINYYEMNQKVGDPFEVTTPKVKVDGFTDTNSKRFCLGSLSSLNRNPAIEKTKKYIGNGLKLKYENSDIFVECLSEGSIFVHSVLLNRLNRLNHNTAYKVSKGMQVKIFDHRFFNEFVYENHIYETTFQLIEMCQIHISFAKGWGGKYPRERYTDTPCWIEVTLNSPMMRLDRMLSQLGAPLNPISSTS